MKDTYNWDVEIKLEEIDVDVLKQEIVSIAKEINGYKGNVVPNLLKVLELDDQLSIILSHIYTLYSHQADMDLADAKKNGELQLIKSFYYEIIDQLSFIVPEILSFDSDDLIKIAHKPEFSIYKKMLLDLVKSKQYTLSDREENVLAKVGEVTSVSYDIYSTLTNAEIEFDKITDKTGQVLDMDESKWAIYSQSYDRLLRQNAFKSLLNGYKKYKQTISTIYLSHLKSLKFYTNVRGYNSPRHRALYNNSIDEVIYDNLVEVINDKAYVNHEYIKLRKDIMNLDEMHLYDLYAPIVKDVTNVYSYDAAHELVINSLKVLGDDYVEDIKTAFTNQSIDVYPTKGKRSGAYSGGSFDTKPYILLNYTDTLNDVFTLTHELGHSMHSLNTNNHQPYVNSNYKIFVAEVASTVNELLLYNYLKKQDIDINYKKFLISYNLDQFRTTVFRQTMFAEFEQESNMLFYNNEEVNEEILSDLYYQLNRKYFGDHVIIDEEIKYEWLRIPHFYYNFYVYQYATSFCISQIIVDEILKGNQQMLNDYLAFLKAGDSINPIELIKTMNIDITSKQPIIKAMEIYKETIEEFKNL